MEKEKFNRGLKETRESFSEFKKKGLKERTDLLTIVGEYMLTEEYRELNIKYKARLQTILGMIMNEEIKILNEKVICGAGIGFEFSGLRRYLTFS